MRGEVHGIENGGLLTLLLESGLYLLQALDHPGVGAAEVESDVLRAAEEGAVGEVELLGLL